MYQKSVTSIIVNALLTTLSSDQRWTSWVVIKDNLTSFSKEEEWVTRPSFFKTCKVLPDRKRLEDCHHIMNCRSLFESSFCSSCFVIDFQCKKTNYGYSLSLKKLNGRSRHFQGWCVVRMQLLHHPMSIISMMMLDSQWWPSEMMQVYHVCPLYVSTPSLVTSLVIDDEKTRMKRRRNLQSLAMCEFLLRHS